MFRRCVNGREGHEMASRFANMVEVRFPLEWCAADFGFVRRVVNMFGYAFFVCGNFG